MAKSLPRSLAMEAKCSEHACLQRVQTQSHDSLQQTHSKKTHLHVWNSCSQELPLLRELNLSTQPGMLLDMDFVTLSQH